MAKNNSQSTQRTAAPKTTPQPAPPAARAEQTKDVIADANEEKQGVNQDPATGIQEDVEPAPVDPLLPSGSVIMTAPTVNPEEQEKTFEETRRAALVDAVNQIVDKLGTDSFQPLTDLADSETPEEFVKILKKWSDTIKGWAENQEEEFQDDDDDSKLRLIGKGQIPDNLESGATLFAGFDKNLRIGSFVGKKGHKFRIDTKAAAFDDDHGRRIHQYMITHVPQEGEEELPLKARFFRGTFEEIEK